MGNLEEKSLRESLINAETEEEVIALLKEAGYWNSQDCWRYYGDKDLNWSQAGGQQGRADFALNEKVINSIDSILTLHCLLAGVDPEGVHAPTSMRGGGKIRREGFEGVKNYGRTGGGLAGLVQP